MRCLLATRHFLEIMRKKRLRLGSVGLFTPDTEGDEIISAIQKPVAKFRWINLEGGSQDLTKDQRLEAVVIPVCMK